MYFRNVNDIVTCLVGTIESGPAQISENYLAIPDIVQNISYGGKKIPESANENRPIEMMPETDMLMDKCFFSPITLDSTLGSYRLPMSSMSGLFPAFPLMHTNFHLSFLHFVASLLFPFLSSPFSSPSFFPPLSFFPLLSPAFPSFLPFLLSSLIPPFPSSLRAVFFQSRVSDWFE